MGGATSSCALIPNVGVHVANHLGWEEMLSQTHNQSVLINGYILTGWQRYDHFASLCEFLPVAIPTLKLVIYRVFLTALLFYLIIDFLISIFLMTSILELKFLFFQIDVCLRSSDIFLTSFSDIL